MTETLSPHLGRPVPTEERVIETDGVSVRFPVGRGGCWGQHADSDTVHASPRHPYTEALLSSVPIPNPPLQRARQRIVLQGEIPNPTEPPPGCRFQTRCPLVQDVCRRESPPLEEKSPGHWAACFVR